MLGSLLPMSVIKTNTEYCSKYVIYAVSTISLPRVQMRKLRYREVKGQTSKHCQETAASRFKLRAG